MEEEELDWLELREEVLSRIDSGTLEATCAFCGASLGVEAPGSLWMAVGSTRDEASQGFFAHSHCLAEKLHESIPFDRDMFEPDP